MPRYVAFLRALNVGGARSIRMESLRRVFEDMGFADVSTYIASGNVIFQSPARDTVKLEQRIEGGLIDALGYDATPFVRTGPEVQQIAAFKAFPRSHIGPTDEIGVLLLSSPPTTRMKQALVGQASATDELRVKGCEIYWLRHRGPAGEIYSTVAFDRVLDQPFTIRSIRTMQNIAAKYFPEGNRSNGA